VVSRDGETGSADEVAGLLVAVDQPSEDPLVALLGCAGRRDHHDLGEASPTAAGSECGPTFALGRLRPRMELVTDEARVVAVEREGVGGHAEDLSAAVPAGDLALVGAEVDVLLARPTGRPTSTRRRRVDRPACRKAPPKGSPAIPRR
jgi:hypothetical protein